MTLTLETNTPYCVHTGASHVKEAQVAVALSQGILAIQNLAQFLGVKSVLSPREAKRLALPADVVLAWGRKGTSKLAVEYAKKRALPIWYLEDGWVRTCSEQAHSRRMYSMLIDTEGVFYDATCPSGIENFLNLPDSEFGRICDEEALRYAVQCRHQLVINNISKYNYYKTSTLADSGSLDANRVEGELQSDYVLVIDQTVDDASVHYGAMDERMFRRMLDSAIAENPNKPVIVRTHPDVVAGLRQGYLAEYGNSQGITVLPGYDNPIPWVKQARRVYVGTSQLGYEALLCGTPVTIFGLPFYAGWGLADERQQLPRRIRKRSIDQIFFASHIHFTRYCSPVSGRRWQLHETLDHVCLQQETFLRNARNFHCVGITPWKKRYIQQFLRSPDGSVSFGNETPPKSADTLVTWGFRRFNQLSHQPSLPVWRLEDGFMRSVGLGSNYTAPGSLVVDGKGLYFDPGASSDLEALLNDYDCQQKDLERASVLRQLIVDSRVSKYDVAHSYQFTSGSADKLCVLVTGQVEDDESIMRGCSNVSTNAELLRAVRKSCPDAWIVYRPHPDVQAGNRRGKVDPFTEQSCADVVDTESSIIECIEACDELHTMTSLSGFEALLRHKTVVTYGSPFYSGWGLTTDSFMLKRRHRKRSLEELIFLVLIKYPRYIDIDSGEFITAEQMVRLIARQKEQAAGIRQVGWASRQVSKAVNIVRGLRYAP